MPSKKDKQVSTGGTVSKAPKKVAPMSPKAEPKGKEPVRNNAATERVTAESSRAGAQRGSGTLTDLAKDTYGTFKSKTAAAAKKAEASAGCFSGCEPGGGWDKECCQYHFQMGQEDHDL